MRLRIRVCVRVGLISAFVSRDHNVLHVTPSNCLVAGGVTVRLFARFIDCVNLTTLCQTRTASQAVYCDMFTIRDASETYV